jgi:hypothetical protein
LGRQRRFGVAIGNVKPDHQANGYADLELPSQEAISLIQRIFKLSKGIVPRRGECLNVSGIRAGIMPL